MEEREIVDRDDFATTEHGQEIERDVEDVEIQSPGVEWQLDGPLPRYRPAIEGEVGDTAVRDPSAGRLPVAEHEKLVLLGRGARETADDVLAVPLVAAFLHADVVRVYADTHDGAAGSTKP